MIVTPASQVYAEPLTPIEPTERIEVLDGLRGFALIGIMFMNIEWFNRAIKKVGYFDYQLTGIDWGSGWLVRLLIEGKFYKIFSILFGMGFAVMLIKAQQKGRPFFAWFMRRMLVLTVIGVLHFAFLWGGDILHNYGIAGCILLLWIWLLGFKKMQWANHHDVFLRLGLGIALLPMVVMLCVSIYFGITRAEPEITADNQRQFSVEQQVNLIQQDPSLSLTLEATAIAERDDQQRPPTVDEATLSPSELIEHQAQRQFIAEYKRELNSREEYEVLKNGSYLQVVVYWSSQVPEHLGMALVSGVFIFFPMFLIGYWFISSGTIRQPAQHLYLFRTMAWLGMGCGLLVGSAALIISANPISNTIGDFTTAAAGLFFLSQYLMTAGYIGIFALLTINKRGQRLIAWLAPLGKLALTHYLLQSVVMAFLFYGIGLGWYGEISRTGQLGLVILTIMLQIMLSMLWLRFYRIGPMEWVWRSLTYLRMQPLT